MVEAIASSVPVVDAYLSMDYQLAFCDSAERNKRRDILILGVEHGVVGVDNCFRLGLFDGDVDLGTKKRMSQHLWYGLQ